ncbi:MAG: hypothetical protein Kow00127_11410 [Bacteroidales bacterium]
MNRIISLITLIMLAVSNLPAQSTWINSSEETVLINGIQVNSIYTRLKGSPDQVKKAWVDFVKLHSGEKPKETDGVFTLKETVIHQITDKRGDLLAMIHPVDQETNLYVAYQLGYDVYVNSAQFPEEFSNLKKFAELFIMTYYDSFLPGFIKEKAQKLKVLKKEHDKAGKELAKKEKANRKLTKKNGSLSRKISKLNEQESTADSSAVAAISGKKAELQAKLNANEKMISDNAAVIESKKSLIESQKPQIAELEEDIKTAALTLNEVESRLKSLDQVMIKPE